MEKPDAKKRAKLLFFGGLNDLKGILCAVGNLLLNCFIMVSSFNRLLI